MSQQELCLILHKMMQIGKDIQKAQQLLDQGEVVGIPTETVYGLAANALNEKAVAKIFEAKDRPSFNPLIIHLASIAQISDYVEEIPPLILPLLHHFCPGPLTFLLKKKTNIPDIVTAGSSLVAIRIPSHPMTQALLQKVNYPLAAPSANPFGYISPVSAQHVYDQLQHKVPYVLDGGMCQVGIESTIIGVEEDTLVVYRLGGITIEQIETLTGSKVRLANKSKKSPQTSGMLKHHYAPKKELLFFDNTIEAHEIKDDDCLLLFGENIQEIPSERQFTLSSNKDLQEAASKLFPLLHELDDSPYTRILVKALPERGLGRAINDRLKRASSNF